MTPPTTSSKVLLGLSLLVLVLHVMLLQNLPLSLSGMAVQPALQSFATRTLGSATPIVAATTPVRTRPIRPKSALRPVAAPNPPVTGNPAQVETGAVVEPVVDAAPTQPVAAPPTQDEVAAAALAAQVELPVARPPREVPVMFSVNELPGSIKLLYRASANKFPFNLDGELIWQPSKDRYQARLSFGVWGKTRVQTSRGLIGPDGLAPERFSDKLNSEVAAHFNRALGRVTFSANTPDAPLLAGAQDRLSVLVQLAALVATAPERFGPATTLTIQIIGPREADLWLFTVGNMELLDLPGGPLQALKLTRNPRHSHDQQVDIWLAPALGYLPARIRLLETNGDYIDQQWLASEAVPAP